MESAIESIVDESIVVEENRKTVELKLDNLNVPENLKNIMKEMNLRHVLAF